jgi:hypothetical protein
VNGHVTQRLDEFPDLGNFKCCIDPLQPYSPRG